jgi:hypothetical protein
MWCRVFSVDHDPQPTSFQGVSLWRNTIHGMGLRATALQCVFLGERGSVIPSRGCAFPRTPMGCLAWRGVQGIPSLQDTQHALPFPGCVCSSKEHLSRGNSVSHVVSREWNVIPFPPGTRKRCILLGGPPMGVWDGGDMDLSLFLQVGDDLSREPLGWRGWMRM